MVISGLGLLTPEGFDFADGEVVEHAGGGIDAHRDLVVARLRGVISTGVARAELVARISVPLTLTAVFKRVPEGYIAFVAQLRGATMQGAMLDEARENLREAVQLVLEANRELARQDARRRRHPRIAQDRRE